MWRSGTHDHPQTLRAAGTVGGDVVSGNLEAAWKRFERMVLPESAGEVQRSEMRKAFMGGASILFTMIMRTLDGGADATESDLAIMGGIQREIDAYGAELDEQVFKRPRGQS